MVRSPVYPRRNLQGGNFSIQNFTSGTFPRRLSSGASKLNHYYHLSPLNFNPTLTFQEIHFDHPPFHPLICPFSGILNTTDTFPEWNYHETHIWQLLKYLQCVFERPEICLNSTTLQDKDAKINREAMELLDENKAEFILKAKDCVEASKEKVYLKPKKEDRHNIIFEKFDSDVHGPVLESIKARTDASIISPPSSGLSWVNNDGDFKPLSKPEE